MRRVTPAPDILQSLPRRRVVGTGMAAPAAGTFASAIRGACINNLERAGGVDDAPALLAGPRPRSTIVVRHIDSYPHRVDGTRRCFTGSAQLPQDRDEAQVCRASGADGRFVEHVPVPTALNKRRVEVEDDALRLLGPGELERTAIQRTR